MPEERAQRRLAAILAADVVGYSRLMQADEAGTLATLKARRSEVLQPVVSRHHGRIVKVMGDGVLIEFASAVDAVECAVQLQEAMGNVNVGLPEDRRIVLRVGINLGDVIVEGSDLYGDGINIATRIESLAEPGSVYLSQAVFSHVHGKVPFGFDDRGEQRLKNIAGPIRVYKVSVGKPGQGATTRLESSSSTPSIAVLPFTNMSGDPEQEYFADGMVEEIITALSRFRNLFVTARNSSFTYKGRAVDVKQVGRELGVRYVLEGSVRKAANRLRITGQLIDASTGAHLWADRFDGAIADVFDLQDQVTASVVGAIAPKLEEAEIERAKLKPTGDLTAYDYYLRGLSFASRMTREANDEALRLFNKAIECDPNFALAYARAADCYVHRKGHGWMVDRAHEIAEAVRLARRAIEFGKDDATALTCGGIVLGYVAGNVDDCAAFIDRALALNANLAMAWADSGWVRAILGEPDTAVEHTARAMRLSPVDPSMFIWETVTALGHVCAGRYDEAAFWAEQALRDEPNFTSAMRMGAVSYVLAGRMAEAQRMMARLRQTDPGLRVSNLVDVMPRFRRPEDRARIVEGLRKAGLPE
jgi:adenylate cyclase